jgi:hypothetical protein
LLNRAQYFKSKSTLPSTGYWHGVVSNTSDTSGGFMFADNSSVPQNYSTSPYAHWAWNYITKRAAGGYSCVVARGSQPYDFFIGDSSQLSLKAYFSSTLDNKFGWDLEVGLAAADQRLGGLCERWLPVLVSCRDVGCLCLAPPPHAGSCSCG